MNPGRLRLLSLREQTEAAGVVMDSQRGRFAALADPSAAPRAVSAFSLFQTPPELADRLAGLLLEHIGPDSVVLEPSAGLGRLYQAVRRAGFDGQMILAEQSPDCCRELYGMIAGDNATLKQGDFLGMELQADAVIMNPPFKMWRDIKHINRARSLAPVVVALCANGPRQRAKLMPEAAEWYDLGPGPFKSEGANVNVAIAVFY